MVLSKVLVFWGIVKDSLFLVDIIIIIIIIML
jgi:hypothetical protein